MGKMAFNLLNAAAADPHVHFTVFSDNPALPVHLPEGLHGERVVWEARGLRFRRWEQFSVPFAAWRQGCSLLHCPGTWCPLWQPVPVVVTIHDTIPWRSDDDRLFVHRIAPAAYARARAIITVSESSAADIAAKWPSLEPKISVIGHGVDDVFLRDSIEAPPGTVLDRQRPASYLLYVGGGIPRKRLPWALKLWQELGQPGLGFVACGLGASERERWVQTVAPEFRDQFSCPDFVPEEVMASLYAYAELVLYPTLDEGFGLPALEAQATGTRIMMSAVGGLRGLIGPAAVVLPQDDFGTWLEACRVFLGDKSARARSREWASAFTWRDAWAKTLAVYERAMSRS